MTPNSPALPFGKLGCHGFGVFDKAVSSRVNNAFEELGLTEDDKTVAPFILAFNQTLRPKNTLNSRRSNSETTFPAGNFRMTV